MQVTGVRGAGVMGRWQRPVEGKQNEKGEEIEVRDGWGAIVCRERGKDD